MEVAAAGTPMLNATVRHPLGRCPGAAVFDRYPADIAAWIEAKGGVTKMPAVGYWILPASELWAMGYRKCD